MICTQTFYFKPSELNSQEAYARLTDLLGALAVHQHFRQWWLPRRSAKDVRVPFLQRDSAITRLDDIQRKLDEKFPGVNDPMGASILLTNADSDRQWREQGSVSVSYRPGAGELRIEVSNSKDAYEDFGGLLWMLLSAMSQAEPIKFACCNVQQKVGSELLLYSNDRAPFPHRQFLGWMGYVPKALTQDQVPAAITLQPSGEGTLVRSTEVLDLADPHAIKQANQVEMSLADLDLLPVIDPTMQ